MILCAMWRIALICGQVLFNAGSDFRFDVVQMHHFILDVEIEFPPQKATEVLVDEVIKGVAGSVVGEMFIERGAVWILLRIGTFAASPASHSAPVQPVESAWLPAHSGRPVSVFPSQVDIQSGPPARRFPQQ